MTAQARPVLLTDDELDDITGALISHGNRMTNGEPLIDLAHRLIDDWNDATPPTPTTLAASPFPPS